MNQTETTITLETAKIVTDGVAGTKSILDEVTNVANNIWADNKTIVVAGGVLLVMFWVWSDKNKKK